MIGRFCHMSNKFELVKLIDPIVINIPGGLTFRGEYDNLTAYDIGDVVSYAPTGSSYIATTSTTGNLPTDTNFWMLLAQGTLVESIDDLDDVDTSTNPPNIGEVLEWDGSDWVPAVIPSAPVTSVNGQTGVVVLTTTDINEGTNLYFTDERAQDAVGNILTDTATVDFTYDDGANTISADVIQGGINTSQINNDAGFVDAAGAAAAAPVQSVFTRTGAVVAQASDYDAVQIDFDNTVVNELSSTEVQGAIDELTNILFPSSGRIYYVDAANGNDSNSGLNIENAFLTIQAAINAAGVDETISILPGTYTENLSFNGKTNLTLDSYIDPPIDTHNVEIRGSHTFSAAQRVRMVGFQLDDNSVPATTVLDFTGCLGACFFDNITFDINGAGSEAIASSTGTSFYVYRDIGLQGEFDFSTGSSSHIFVRSTGTGNVTMNGPAVTFNDCLAVPSITHQSGILTLTDCDSFNRNVSTSITSTAADAAGNQIYMTDCNFYTAATNDYGIINIANCDYFFNDVKRDPSQDILPANLAKRLTRGINAIDHAYDNTSSGLTADNVQDAIDEVTALDYLFKPGEAGGQTAFGGTAAGENLTLGSTANATKGSIILGTSSAFDETNNRLGLGVTTPASPIDLLYDPTVGTVTQWIPDTGAVGNNNNAWDVYNDNSDLQFRLNLFGNASDGPNGVYDLRLGFNQSGTGASTAGFVPFKYFVNNNGRSQWNGGGPGGVHEFSMDDCENNIPNMIIRGRSTFVADYLQIRNVSQTVLSRITNAGNVAAPGSGVGLTFTNDLDTGVSRLGANNLALTVGGSDIVDVDSSGVSLPSGARIDEFSTDGTLTDNSDTAVPTEQAVKTYTDTHISTRAAGTPDALDLIEFADVDDSNIQKNATIQEIIDSTQTTGEIKYRVPFVGERNSTATGKLAFGNGSSTTTSGAISWGDGELVAIGVSTESSATNGQWTVSIDAVNIGEIVTHNGTVTHQELVTPVAVSNTSYLNAICIANGGGGVHTVTFWVEYTIDLTTFQGPQGIQGPAGADGSDGASSISTGASPPVNPAPTQALFIQSNGDVYTSGGGTTWNFDFTLPSGIKQITTFTNVVVGNINSTQNFPGFDPASPGTGTLLNDLTSEITINASSITINTAGRYRLYARVYMSSTAQRPSPSFQWRINTINTGRIANTSYIRSSAGHNNASTAVEEILDLAASDTVELRAIQDGNTGTVSVPAGNSLFIVEKIPT